MNVMVGQVNGLLAHDPVQSYVRWIEEGPRNPIKQDEKWRPLALKTMIFHSCQELSDSSATSLESYAKRANSAVIGQNDTFSWHLEKETDPNQSYELNALHFGALPFYGDAPVGSLLHAEPARLARRMARSSRAETAVHDQLRY